MSAEHYLVTNAADTGAQFRSLAALAASQGRFGLFLEASKWAVSELARTPDEFGESWKTLPTTGLVLRRGFSRPLYIEYAIDPDNKIVYLRRVSLVR